MYKVLALYARPYDKKYPVVCMDEKSKQLMQDVRGVIPLKPGSPEKYDSEYCRKGTRNIFVAVEPLAGKRKIKVTLNIFSFSIELSSLIVVTHLMISSFSFSRLISAAFALIRSQFTKTYCFAINKSQIVDTAGIEGICSYPGRSLCYGLA